MTLDNESNSQDERVIVITRSFEAARVLIYRLWTDPQYIALWWGVEDSTISNCQMDVRVGGVWYIEMRTLGGTIYPNAFEFREVVDNERLVYVDRHDPNSPAWKGRNMPAPAVHTVTFEDVNDRTLVTIHSEFATRNDRDQALNSGMMRGIGQSLDRLERLIAKFRAGSAETPEHSHES